MISSNKNIKSLLEKYWAAETSLEEEKEIFAYFQQEEIDEELKEYAPLFSYLQEERDITIDVSESVLDKIQQLEAKPQGKIIAFPWRRAVAIAASFLVLLTLGINAYKSNQLKKQQLTAMDTFQTPEEALEQTMKALAYISAKMNKGTEKATLSLSKTETLDLLNQ